jgi:hypothetical protein
MFGPSNTSNNLRKFVTFTIPDFVIIPLCLALFFGGLMMIGVVAVIILQAFELITWLVSRLLTPNLDEWESTDRNRILYARAFKEIDFFVNGYEVHRASVKWWWTRRFVANFVVRNNRDLWAVMAVHEGI